MLRRKRIPDGSLGPLENVFEDKEENLKEEVKTLKEQVADLQGYIVDLEFEKLLNQGGVTNDI